MAVLTDLDVVYDNKAYGNIIDPTQWNANFKIIEEVVNENNDEIESHFANTENPHTVTKTQVGLGNVDNVQQATKSEFNEFVARTDNPHGVTSEQVGAYSKTQVETSGSAAIHWGNLTNVPNLADASWKASVANRAGLPLTGNSLSDQRVVLDDGDGKQAVYLCIAITGDVDAQWDKIGDVDWNTEEATRVTQESARVIAEGLRVSAESSRTGVESARVSAESGRNSAEGLRVTSETNRGSAEGLRATAETGRSNAESGRSSAEGLRVTAETGRSSAEGLRVTAEGLRVTAETSRSNAEIDRVSDEGLRGTAEIERSSAEDLRLTAETNRGSAEGLRVTAETGRSNAEINRVSAEGLRGTAEIGRSSAEDLRVTAETNRGSAEALRITAENSRNLFGDYVAETSYVVGNKVVYNGSSYICILASIGNLPTNATYWKLIAAKGLDGTGSGDMAKSVYDTNGNDIVDNAEKVGGFTVGVDVPSYAAFTDTHVLYVIGTQTTTTASWTGVATELEALTHGTTVQYWLPRTSASNATLNLTLKGGSTTGAINCYFTGTTRVGTQYAAGSLVTMIYLENALITGTPYTGWFVSSYINTVYTHPTTAGNKHIPTGGTVGQIMTNSASGTAVWGDQLSVVNGLAETVTGKVLDATQGKALADLVSTKKRTSRFTIGTSTAGWTTSDCDYLCDGTADDVEINAAITALPATGGEIVILDGTYNITAEIDVNKNNISIRGNGNATILKRMFNSLEAEGVITLSSRSGCKIANLQIDGNKTSYSSYDNYSIYLGSSSNNTITGNTCNNAYYGIRLSSSSDNTITGNTCNSNNYGIYLSYSNSNTITGNTCNNNNSSGICLYFSSNSVITGNTCNNNGNGVYLDNANSSTITGNTCNNNNIGIHLVFSNNSNITGNTFIRGTGQASDYTASQYTIKLEDSENNLISSNICMGKAVANLDGTGNTLVNNKYNAT